MDRFDLKMDQTKFSSTNSVWNKLEFNNRTTTGTVSDLIKGKQFSSKEEWTDHYFKSGEDREKQLSLHATQQEQFILNSPIKTSELTNLLYINPFFAKLNLNYGRSKEQLRLKAQKLLEIFKDLTLLECRKIVFHRIIGETWNGIYLREYNTVVEIKNRFPEASMIPTSGETDWTFGVDVEFCLKGKILCGIQIKPQSYYSNADYILKAKKANERKHENYFLKYNREVLTIYSEEDGTIVEDTNNEKSLEKLKNLLITNDRR